MYELLETKIKDDDGKIIRMYGIQKGEIIFTALSSNKSAVVDLCNSCNKLQLSEKHFCDVVEDFILKIDN